MMTEQISRRIIYTLLFLIIVLSLPIKLFAAQNMPFDIDIVPVLSRSVEYTLPPIGTLSSVAAYNMPLLQWLHLPALHLTHNVFWAILLTMLTLNILTTIAIFCIGDSMFSGRVGLIAAGIFTFSEVGISSAYTAWAQLLLPFFFAMTFLFLWQWRKHEKGLYLALSGIMATAGFMTHFSAILLFPAMLIFALITRAKWQWMSLLAGAIVCVLMLTPYLLYESKHDFVDMKAFIAQENRVSPAVMRSVQYLKSESGRLPREIEPESAEPSQRNPQNNQIQSQPKPRWQRGLDFLLSVPAQYRDGLRFAFDTHLRVLPKNFRPFMGIPTLLWIVSVGWALWDMIRRRNFNLTETAQGRLLLIALCEIIIITGLIFTRNINQLTYFTGLSALHVVIVSGIFAHEKLPRFALIFGVILALIFTATTLADRTSRLLSYDDSEYTRLNVSLYRHVSASVDYIADDWQGASTLTVSYDIMPEMRNLWWVVAWHSIDPTYRMGMNFDFLLTYHHDLTNMNTDPVGFLETADYFVVYEPGLSRWTLDDYTVSQFGTIYVLKPQ